MESRIVFLCRDCYNMCICQSTMFNTCIRVCLFRRILKYKIKNEANCFYKYLNYLFSFFSFLFSCCCNITLPSLWIGISGTPNLTGGNTIISLIHLKYFEYLILVQRCVFLKAICHSMALAKYFWFKLDII